MKQLSLFPLLLLALIVVSSSSCRSDDDDGSNSLFFELRHDGSNLTAPALPAGYNELAARFTRNDLSSVVGGQLERVQVFLARVPQRVEIVVYDQGTESTPGQELYVQDVTANVTTTGLQEFRLDTPISVADREIWISVGVLVDQAGDRVVGCDAGPAEEGGDHILFSTNQDWDTFRNLSGGQESVNWNIRGVVRRPE
ncbi:MAG: hypothetical protein AAFR97_00475 [Bacteroidota bacterium]